MPYILVVLHVGAHYSVRTVWRCQDGSSTSLTNAANGTTPTVDAAVVIFYVPPGYENNNVGEAFVLR